MLSHFLCELALFLENMGVLRGYTLLYKEASYFFMLLPLLNSRKPVFRHRCK